MNQILKRVLWRAVTAVFAVTALVVAIDAQGQTGLKPPERMTYQGFISGTDGVPLGNTAPKNYDVYLRIYDTESSTTPLWAEQQTVTVDKGYFSVLLGEGAAVPGLPNAGVTLSSLFINGTTTDRYVGFIVKGIGPGGTDLEIMPRVRFMTSPFAFLANRAQTASLADTATLATKATTATFATTAGTATNALSVSVATNAFALVQYEAPNAQLISGSGTNLVVNAPLFLKSGQYIQLGSDVTNREYYAGQIAYGKHSGNGLDIVGAGTSGVDRRVNVWAEGGFTHTGPVNLQYNYSLRLGTSAGLHAHSCELGYMISGNQGYFDIIGAGPTEANRRMLLHAQQDLALFAPLRIPHGYIYQDLSKYPINVETINAYNAVSIRAVGYVQALGFPSVSDRRIKEDIREVDAQESIETLRKIRVSDYQFKSAMLGRSKHQRGVIAQELESVLPTAVSQSKNMISVQEEVAEQFKQDAGTKAIRVQMGTAHGLIKGAQIGLKMDETMTTVTVDAVPDDKTFEFTPFGLAKVPTRIAVVQREVDDFRTVEYQTVYMTALRALQEVERRLQVVEQREARMDALERKAARVDALEQKAARVEALENDVAQLRKIVADIQVSSKKSAESAAVSALPSTSVANAR